MMSVYSLFSFHCKLFINYCAINIILSMRLDFIQNSLSICLTNILIKLLAHELSLWMHIYNYLINNYSYRNWDYE
jgi:hypothetical protein